MPFFLVAAAVCFLLVPVSPDEFRKVAGGVGAVYVVLAVMSFLDSRGRSQPRPDDEPPGG